MLPHLEKASVCMGAECPESSASKCPWAKSHRRIWVSAPADAKNLPSTEKLSVQIGALCPVISLTWFPVTQSQRRTVRSLEPVAM
jgi:hypothetical protein